MRALGEQRLRSSHADRRDDPLMASDAAARTGWALVWKTHHCLVDGVGSVDVVHLLLDPQRVPAEPSELSDGSGTRLALLRGRPARLVAPSTRAGPPGCRRGSRRGSVDRVCAHASARSVGALARGGSRQCTSSWSS
ncbi:MAG: wax ester/triacylglycerol synthase domain-containing protein [Solirubrobacteraceae bacterium]